MIRVVGIDPGGHECGIVVRAGSELLHAELVTNDTNWLAPRYLGEVIDAARSAADRATAEAPVIVAIEDLVVPNPHLGMLAVRGILDTAQVLGALRFALELYEVVLVPPGGHGSAPLSTYPPALVGEHEPRGKGRLRHCRSAWDIAGTAKTIAAMQAR